MKLYDSILDEEFGRYVKKTNTGYGLYFPAVQTYDEELDVEYRPDEGKILFKDDGPMSSMEAVLDVEHYKVYYNEYGLYDGVEDEASTFGCKTALGALERFLKVTGRDTDKAFIQFVGLSIVDYLNNH